MSSLKTFLGLDIIYILELFCQDEIAAVCMTEYQCENKKDKKSDNAMFMF